MVEMGVEMVRMVEEGVEMILKVEEGVEMVLKVESMEVVVGVEVRMLVVLVVVPEATVEGSQGVWARLLRWLSVLEARRLRIMENQC